MHSTRLLPVEGVILLKRVQVAVKEPNTRAIVVTSVVVVRGNGPNFRNVIERQGLWLLVTLVVLLLEDWRREIVIDDAAHRADGVLVVGFELDFSQLHVWLHDEVNDALRGPLIVDLVRRALLTPQGQLLEMVLRH